MKFLVCISQVPDTETKIRISPGGESLDHTETTWIINPWDQLSLTRAVALKKEFPSIVESVTVISVGNGNTEHTLRKALSLGADKALRIDAEPLDSWFVARQISEIINKDYFDIVFTGIESSDFNGYAVGGMLAELTGYTCLPDVSSIDIAEGRVMVQREVEGGREKLEAVVPFIAVIQKGIASAPSISSMKGIMEARKKDIEVVPAIDAEYFTEYIHYELPALKKECELITETNLYELVTKLHAEAGIA